MPETHRVCYKMITVLSPLSPSCCLPPYKKVLMQPGEVEKEVETSTSMCHPVYFTLIPRLIPLPPLRRANALEEQLKEQELRADQTLLEEIKKQREMLSKMEREKSIEIENLQARWGWGRAGWRQVSQTCTATGVCGETEGGRG